MMAEAAAVAFALFTAVVVAFQLGLALGAPWGEYAMGGRFPGRFPPSMRAAAAVQAAILVGLAVVVLSRGGAITPRLAADAGWLGWLPVVVSAISVAVNAVSPSLAERRRWVPIGLIMLATSLVVATSPA